jgi:hypothetical protein
MSKTMNKFSRCPALLREMTERGERFYIRFAAPVMDAA